MHTAVLLDVAQQPVRPAILWCDTRTTAECAAIRDESNPATGIKLYNAGSFFDPRAVPEPDYEDIAKAVSGFSRVIVECHPALVGRRAEDRSGGSRVHRHGQQWREDPARRSARQDRRPRMDE